MADLKNRNYINPAVMNIYFNYLRNLLSNFENEVWIQPENFLQSGQVKVLMYFTHL
jgi:hypothetical protein